MSLMRWGTCRARVQVITTTEHTSAGLVVGDVFNLCGRRLGTEGVSDTSCPLRRARVGSGPGTVVTVGAPHGRQQSEELSTVRRAWVGPGQDQLHLLWAQTVTPSRSGAVTAG